MGCAETAGLGRQRSDIDAKLVLRRIRCRALRLYKRYLTRSRPWLGFGSTRCAGTSGAKPRWRSRPDHDVRWFTARGYRRARSLPGGDAFTRQTGTGFWLVPATGVYARRRMLLPLWSLTASHATPHLLAPCSLI